jgi:hypothetical protein
MRIIDAAPQRLDRDQLFGDRAAPGFTRWNELERDSPEG